MSRSSKIALITIPLITGIAISQSVSAATSSQSSTAEAKAAYNSAYTNLEHTRFLQMTQIEKRIELAQLTASGEKNAAIKKQFEQAPQYESNVARIDGSNKSEPITLYERYSRLIGGEDGYLSVGWSLFTDVGHGWTRYTTLPRDITDSMSTIRSIPPLETFINLGVQQIPGGFVVSGYINVKKYYAEDPNELLSMARLFPNASTTLKNRIIAETYEHDTVTIKRVGNENFVTNDVSARWAKLTGRDLTALLVVPAYDVSYLKSATSEIDARTQYSYATLTVKLPGTVEKALAGNTVTSSVYGGNS